MWERVRGPYIGESWRQDDKMAREAPPRDSTVEGPAQASEPPRRTLRVTGNDFDSNKVRLGDQQ